MPDPEAIARQDIDRQLEAAGWIVQDRHQLTIYAGARRLIFLIGCDNLAAMALRELADQRQPVMIRTGSH